jgi:UDP-N-acetylmuramate: L-alanyl-gamma-D-glutamyl-meso-diaminopimelate ligase
LAVFQQEYASAFEAADYVVISEVFDSGKAVEKGRTLDTAKLILDISGQKKPAFCMTNADTIVRHLTPELRPGDVVAVMSNGGFDGIHEKLLKVLRAKSEAQSPD